MNLPPDPPMGDRQDRWLTIATVVVIVGIVLTVLLGVWTVVASSTAANNADEVARGNRIAACRTRVYSDAQDAAGALDRARADLDVLVATGLQAALSDDTAQLDAVLELVPSAIDRVAERANESDAANDAYAVAAQLAVTDPDQFLDQCQEPSP